MKLTAFGLTDKGKVRSENQDQFLIDEQHNIFVVADGVGGLPFGGLASKVAINALKASVTDLKKELDYFDLFNTLNRKVWQTGVDIGARDGIATTLTVAKLEGSQLHIGHIGDCMILLCDDTDWEVCTTSHTAEQAIRDNLPESQKTITLPERYSHTLTRCLGQPMDVEVEVTRKKVRRGQRVLICSDGVNKVLDNDTLAIEARRSTSVEIYVKTIIAEVNARGAPDNATAIGLFFD